MLVATNFCHGIWTANAPSTFQAHVNDIFRRYHRRFVLVFFDKILVHKRDKAFYVAHMRVVLEIFKQNSYKKCCFGKVELEYLGLVTLAKGVASDPSTREWPIPKAIRGLRGVRTLLVRGVSWL